MVEPMYNSMYAHAAALSKNDLIKQISVNEFAITDLSLYLDTHPLDKNALAMYHNLRASLQMQRAEYASAYGPLNVKEVADPGAWTWIRDPWPWEAGSEV